MDILITEEQYKVILSENLIKDTLKDLKINSKILFTFGTGMGAFIGPVTRYLAGSGFSLNGNEIALLIITSVALLINDTNKKELIDEVENLNLGSALESTKKLLDTCLNIIRGLVKKIMGVSYSLSEVLGFAFLLVPVMNVLNLIISDRNITSSNVDDLFKGVILSSLSFLIKNIFARFKGKPSEETETLNEEIEPSERAVKNICDAKKFCRAQGKITFGQLRELVESAKTRRLYLHMGEGGYKATLRLLPWFLPQLAIAGFTGSLLRAFHKIVKPTLEETNNYKTWWGRAIMKIFNLVEGELNVKDPLSKIFFIIQHGK